MNTPPCTADPEAFFPAPAPGSAKRAREICRQCPLQDQCLTEALNIGDIPGVWGGLTQVERRALRRKKAAA